MTTHAVTSGQIPNELRRDAGSLPARRPNVNARRVLIAALLGWSVLDLLFVAQDVTMRRGNSSVDWWLLGVEQFTDWSAWVALMPLVVSLAIRFPVTSMDSAQTGRRIVGLVTAAFVIAALHVILVASLRHVLLQGTVRRAWTDLVRGDAERIFMLDVMVGSTIMLVVCMLVSYEQGKQRAIDTAQLEAELSRTSLAMLSMQLQPHFLFNTLNTIAGLVYSSPEQAERMIAQLGDLLRTSLATDRTAGIMLSEELVLARQYLELQSVRFDERMRVTEDIGADALACVVPTFLLQPLVENVIRHAVSVTLAPVRIEIRAIVVLVDGVRRLHLMVSDDGPGLGTRERVGCDASAAGIGLRNTADRLRHYYGPAAALTLLNREPVGTTALLDIPFFTRTDNRIEVNHVANARRCTSDGRGVRDALDTRTYDSRTTLHDVAVTERLAPC